MTDQPATTARRRGPLAHNHARHAAPHAKRGGVRPLARAGLTATLCALAAGTAVLTSAAPGNAAAAPSKAAATLIPTTCFYVEQYTVEANGLRIHQHPATGAAGGTVLGLAYWPQTVISRRAPLYNAGYWWVYGQDQSTGVTGWMADEYLADDGDIGTCL